MKRVTSLLLAFLMLVSAFSAGSLEAYAESLPGDPAEVLENTEVSDSVDPVENTDPANPMENTDPTETTETTVPDETTEPVDPTDPTESTEEILPGMHASDECIRILKEEEGFCKYPYWDYSQWTVGYGSRCPDDMLDTYKKEGITEKEAEVLLRNFLIAIESEINTRMIDANNLELAQNQFDAMVLFSYNCGTGWLHDTRGTLYNVIKNGATGNELIRPWALWCNAGGQVKEFLLRRRLSEANMYLNGVYNKQPADNFAYVIYNANGGKVSPRSQGYDANLTDKPYSEPTYDGYNFQGWYTKPKGGTKVTVLDSSTKRMTLYAQWLDSEGKAPEDKPFDPVQVTVTGTIVNLREGPGTNYGRVGETREGNQLLIEQTAYGGSYLWGRSSKGWIALEYTNYDKVKNNHLPDADEGESDEVVDPVNPTEPAAPAGQPGVVVNCTELRIRSGPGLGYSCVGYLQVGTRVRITEKQRNGAITWGKTEKGWISLDYVKLEGGADPKPAEMGFGTVRVDGELRIRSGPGTSYTIVGFLRTGDRVEITERRKVNGMVWGKTNRGWISLDYVVMDADSTPSGSGSTRKTVTGDCLHIRSDAGTSNVIVGYLVYGNKVDVLETKDVNGTQWGRISSGWICLDYAK